MSRCLPDYSIADLESLAELNFPRMTNVSNDPWLLGKAAVATRFGEPSLLVKLRHLDAGTPFGQRTDVDHSKFRAHGGSIPLVVAGEMVGTITMSGEPDVIDHEAAAEALVRFSKIHR